MRIILLGPPGTGKGSQAELIAKHYKLCHISTGDIFREKKKDGTPLGKKIAELIDKGNYVPDDVTIEVVKERVAKADCTGGFILDGFPRTVPQAEAAQSLKIDCVLYIVSLEETVIKRLGKRRSCPKCKRNYNLVSHPSKKGELCEDDNTELVQREDDKPETVHKRLAVYLEHTHPLVEYYGKKGLLHEIHGEGNLQEVFSLVKQLLDKVSTRTVA